MLPELVILEKQTLAEKIESVAENGNGNKNISSVFEERIITPAPPVAETIEPVIGDDERRYIDEIAQNPKNKEAYRALGFIYLSQKNFSDARACFRRVLKLNPEDGEVKNKLEEIKGLRGKRITGGI